jgi:hypothetical protein
MTTLLVPAEAEVRRLLGIPEEIALAAHVGVGYRADPWPARLSRRPVEEFAFAERYGEPLTGAGAQPSRACSSASSPGSIE